MHLMMEVQKFFHNHCELHNWLTEIMGLMLPVGTQWNSLGDGECVFIQGAHKYATIYTEQEDDFET